MENEREWDEVEEKVEIEELTIQEIAREEMWQDYYREAKLGLI
jgi:hypothetical protein